MSDNLSANAEAKAQEMAYSLAITVYLHPDGRITTTPGHPPGKPIEPRPGALPQPFDAPNSDKTT